MQHPTSDRWLIPLAFATIYIVWGSTYLANWLAVRELPVFLMCGSRFFVAGVLLFAVSFLFGAKWPEWKHWRSTAFLGAFFFLLGNGGAVWALQFLDSGIAALIIASQPLVTVLLMWVMVSVRPAAKTFLGIGLGFVGMLLLVLQDQFTSSEEMLLGVGVILCCVVGWGYASIKISRIPLPDSKVQGAAMQMLLGGAMLLGAGLATGELGELNLAGVSTRVWWALAYLVVFGSIAAFSAFNFLLLKTTPDKVATSTYVNPVVALFLGWSINDETITNQSLLAAALLLGGVVFITQRKRPTSRPIPVASLADEFGGEREIDLPPAPSRRKLVARIWRGTAVSDRTAEYAAWARQRLVPDFTAQRGYLGLALHRRTEGNISHLTFVSYWQDLDAVKSFAGHDFEKAKLYPEEREMLLEAGERVEHREVQST